MTTFNHVWSCMDPPMRGNRPVTGYALIISHICICMSSCASCSLGKYEWQQSVEQIAFADVILMNKSDLVSVGDRKRVTTRIKVRHCPSTFCHPQMRCPQPGRGWSYYALSHSWGYLQEGHKPQVFQASANPP